MRLKVGNAFRNIPGLYRPLNFQKSIVVSASGLIAAVLNMGFQIIVLQKLSLSQYGKLSVLLGISTFIGYGLSSVVVSSLKAELDTTASGMEKNLIANTVSLCLVAVIILASIAFIDYLLGVSKPGDFLFAAFWVFPLALLNLLLGRIQKRKDFHTFAKAVVGHPLLKLAVGCFTIVWTTNPYFVALALILATVVLDTVLVVFSVKFKELLNLKIDGKRSSQFSNAFLFFVFALLSGIDILLANAYMSPIALGAFAISLFIGKSVVVITKGLTDVIMPEIFDSATQFQSKVRLSERTSLVIICIGMIFAVILEIASPLYRFLLPEDFQSTGMVSLVVLVTCLHGVLGIFVNLLNSLNNRESFQLGIAMGISLMALSIGVLTYEPVGSYLLVCIACFESVFVSLGWHLARKNSKVSRIQVVR